jgi:hypothetical protein
MTATRQNSIRVGNIPEHSLPKLKGISTYQAFINKMQTCTRCKNIYDPTLDGELHTVKAERPKLTLTASGINYSRVMTLSELHLCPLCYEQYLHFVGATGI